MSELQETPAQENVLDNGLDMKTLFVRSIPMDVTDEQLTEFFSNFAPTKHAVVVKDTNKRSRGFGFVSFATEEDAQDALTKARKTKLQNHLLRVDIAKRRDRSKKNETKDTGEPFVNLKENNNSEQSEDADAVDNEETLKGKPKLIIRNMPWSCRDPNKLKKIFSRFGTVVEATIPRKRDGKLCGFAFVTMKKISNCKNALENTTDLKIDGRPVAVDFAIQKNRWEDYKKKHEIGEVSEDSAEQEENMSDHEEGEKESSEDSDVSLDSDEEITDDENNIEKDKDEPAKQQRNRREQFSIFVRNVPYDATAESLADHFSKFGPVKYALPVIDKETGLAKGTAFVAFRDEKTYNYCIENAPAAGATSLLIDDEGNLWIGTNNGLSKFNIKKQKFTNYSEADGLQGTLFNRGAAYKTKSGKMFFGTNKGIISFNPSEIKEEIYNEDKVVLGNIRVNNQLIDYDDNEIIKLNHNENNIEIKYFLPDYGRIGGVSYTYMLEGVDSDWQYPENRNNAIYTLLSPGNYTFKVRGIKSNGDITEETSLNFIVKSPIWRTKTAFILYFIIIVAIVIYVRNHVKILKAIVDRQTKEINAQMETNRKLYERNIKNEKFKNDYFVNLSHELRTPINIIIATVQLVRTLVGKDNLYNENREKYLNIITKSSNNLLGIINDIIDSSKIESGAYKIKKQEG